MNSIVNLTPRQLRRAADLKEKIEKLNQELERMLGASHEANGHIVSTRKRRPRARRVKAKATEPKLQRKRRMSAAARAKIAASARERWKKAKALGKTTL